MVSKQLSETFLWLIQWAPFQGLVHPIELQVSCNFCNLLPTFISWANYKQIKPTDKGLYIHRVTSELQASYIQATAKGLLFQIRMITPWIIL